MRIRMIWAIVCLAAIFVFLPSMSYGQVADVAADPETLNEFLGGLFAGEQESLSNGIIIILVLAVLSLAPAIVIMFTAFVRIMIVLAFTRTALATQQMPPNQVLVGLALFLTAFIMAPTLERMYETAFVPYSNGEIGTSELIDNGLDPLRTFMFANMDSEDSIESLALFLRLADINEPSSVEEVPTTVLVPAFMLSELKRAFELGIRIFIPFIIIDIVIASILLSMGLIFLPPVLVSLPFKIVLFVLVDGWNLLVEMLIEGFVY